MSRRAWLVNAVSLLLAWVSVPRGLAEHLSSKNLHISVKDTLKATILAHPQPSAAAERQPRAWQAQEAEDLAEELVDSLAELFRRTETTSSVKADPDRKSLWRELGVLEAAGTGDAVAFTLAQGGFAASEGQHNTGEDVAGGLQVEEGFFGARMLQSDVPCIEQEAVGGGEEDFLQIESTWMNIALTFVCVVCAGLAAGLTMGLVSIEPLEMAIKQRSGTPEEQRQASRILPLVSRHHFLLVTLLLFNSLANEALPIFLGNLVPSWLAVILSVSLVLFFGEVLPSAIFTGKGQLAIAAGMAWFVYALMIVLGPIAWPLSWLLDRMLGIEGFKRYNRAEIAALVEVQQELSTEDVTNLPLHPDEVAIVNGVLQTAEKSVAEAMITMDKVFCLSKDEKLSGNTMADIMASGYSRVLVYEGTDTLNIRGYLQVKKLIVLSPEDERNISSLMLRVPVVVSPTKSLLELLNTFQTGRSHLALVSHSPGMTLESIKHGVRLEGAARPVGIITLEDIIEEIIQEEIMDESDRLTQFIENRAKDTLLRFARMRQERRVLGRYASLGLGTPVRSNTEKSLLKRLNSNGSPSRSPAPPSPSYQALESGGGGFGSPSVSIGSPPAAPGVGERASLLASVSRPGSNRRVTAAKPPKRGSTVAEAMIAAVGRARDVSDSGHGSIASASGSGSRRVAPPGALSLFRQGSSGSVNDGSGGDRAGASSRAGDGSDSAK